MNKPEIEYGIAFTQTVKMFLPVAPTYKNQFKASIDILAKQLGLMGDALIYPELTLQGQIHYHGVLNVKDKVAYFKGIAKLRKLLGHNLFKYIDNSPKWMTYIKKDEATMEEILDEDLPIVCTYNSEKKIKSVFFNPEILTLSVAETAPELSKDGTLPQATEEALSS